MHALSLASVGYWYRHGIQAVAPQANLPRCPDKTAYVTLWSGHATGDGARNATAGQPSTGTKAAHGKTKSTFMRAMFRRDTTAYPEHALYRPAQLVLVLLRSLRRSEHRCRRDFVLLLGTEVDVPALERSVLALEGVIFRSVPPLLAGVPTADKLWAWSLFANYSQCLVIDTDVMVLRPIDDVFGRAAELTVAHHPYDNVQAQCGIPRERRGIAAMFVLRPSETVFQAYLQFIRRRLTKPLQLMYADQTGLMCFFGLERSETLPCSFLMDAANPLRHATSWKRNCERMLPVHLEKQCMDDSPRGACRAEPKVCTATLRHLQANCEWRRVASDVRAVHFKGKIKPWPPGYGSGERVCRPVMHGPLVAYPEAPGGEATLLKATEDLEWDASLACTARACGKARRPGACVSATSRSRVHWAAYGGVPGRGVPRECCHFHTPLRAEWNQLLMAHTPEVSAVLAKHFGTSLSEELGQRPTIPSLT
jgi:hypothetical protein